MVARDLQKYGMLLADGGQIALTARSDRSTATKWTGLLCATDLAVLKLSDFIMIDGGPRIQYTGDCQRL